MSDMLAHLSNSRCGDKIPYDSEGRAAQVAESRTNASGEWMVAYKCIDCTGWHIGHAPPEFYAEPEAPRRRVRRCNNCGKPTNGTFCGHECKNEARKAKHPKGGH